jgi:cellulose synthase/poly-beta-1,6-N-acetylglucosamine synthase-like glycosyltransferase
MTSPEHRPPGFTVGICATGRSGDLAKLIRSVLSESSVYGLELNRVVVVASDCPGPLRRALRELEAEDLRVQVLLEGARRGKADAVNKILSRAAGRYVVFVNADATPEPGAVANLLSAISSNGRTGAISAMPVVEPKGGASSLLVDLVWSTHNESSRLLNHMDISNHASEELVAFRLSAIGLLPDGLVNDGAYLAQTARKKGYSVRFTDSARVRIETPTRVSDLIAQRRRILFGHAQVWRKAGSPPKTIESLLLFSPRIGLRLLQRVIAKNPRFIVALPLAFVTEVTSALLSISDDLLSSKRHAIWRRFN